MAENIESRLQSLRAQSQEASRRYAQAEAQLDAVRARREQLLAGLKEQGFDTPEDARKEVERIGAEVESVLSQIEERVSGL
jgi:chaperonin cofactor prefoldin